MNENAKWNRDKRELGIEWTNSSGKEAFRDSRRGSDFHPKWSIFRPSTVLRGEQTQDAIFGRRVEVFPLLLFFFSSHDWSSFSLGGCSSPLHVDFDGGLGREEGDTASQWFRFLAVLVGSSSRPLLLGRVGWWWWAQPPQPPALLLRVAAVW